MGSSTGRPLRVGLDIRRAGEFGVGAYITNLVLALARLDAPHQFVLIGREEQFKRLGELPQNFSFSVFHRSFNAPRTHVTYAPFLRNLKLDAFHIPHRWVPYVLPRPYVATLHDLNNLLFPSESEPDWRLRLRLALLRHGFRRAHRVLSVSEATKRDAVSYLGVDPAKITVVPNATDQSLTLPVADAERDRILARYSVDGPFVLYAGRIQPHKNVPRLIEAFGVVRNELADHPKYHNLRLIIIGDQLNEDATVRHAVLRSRVNPYVRFLGFVPADTLRVFYDQAEVFLFPSLYEGFGLPPLEAMAHGTPVVTSSVSSMPEVVGDAAVQVNPKNVFEIAKGLRRALTDEPLRSKLSQLGPARAAQFSWDTTARQVLGVYQAVARRTPKS